MQSEITIRHSPDPDIASITHNLRPRGTDGAASFELEAPDTIVLAKRRSKLLRDGYPYLAARIETRVVGFAYVGPYRSRPAY